MDSSMDSANPRPSTENVGLMGNIDRNVEEEGNHDGVDRVPPSTNPYQKRTEDHSGTYDGVYYGSSDDDNEIDYEGVDALLGEISEPGEHEEPYDILADNGDYLYSEQDQRLYVSTSGMDALLSTGIAPTASPVGMTPISEEEEEEEENEPPSTESGTPGADTDIVAPPETSDPNSDPREILFHAGIEATEPLQPRPPSPPTPLYQIPLDYNIRSVGSFPRSHPQTEAVTDDQSGWDSGTESEDSSQQSASSSQVAGSIKERVREIDSVLDELRPEPGNQRIEEGAIHHPYVDDVTITSDVSAGATTRLSEELEKLSQGVVWEFTGFDAAAYRKQLKKQKKLAKKRRRNLPPPPSLSSPPLLASPGSSVWSRRIGGTKLSTVLMWFVSLALLFGILVVAFMISRNNTKTETLASSSIQSDVITPTASPVMNDSFDSGQINAGTGGGSDGDTGRPAMNAFTETSSTPLPSLRPSKRPPTAEPIQQTTMNSPNFLTTTIASPSPSVTASPMTTSSSFSNDDTDAPLLAPIAVSFARVPVINKPENSPEKPNPSAPLAENEKEGTQLSLPYNSVDGIEDNKKEEDDPAKDEKDSFVLPGGESKPWDDDDFEPMEPNGYDDFYTNDDAYEYNLHHSQASTEKRKETKRWKKEKVDLKKEKKSSKGRKHQVISSPWHHQQQYQWQQKLRKPLPYIVGPEQSYVVYFPLTIRQYQQQQKFVSYRDHRASIQESATSIRQRRKVPRGQ